MLIAAVNRSDSCAWYEALPNAVDGGRPERGVAREGLADQWSERRRIDLLRQARHGVVTEWCNVAEPNPYASSSMLAAMPASPAISRGRRPRRSIRLIASTVKTRLIRPTKIACMNAASVPTPDCWKIIGA